MVSPLATVRTWVGSYPSLVVRTQLRMPITRGWSGPLKNAAAQPQVVIRTNSNNADQRGAFGMAEPATVVTAPSVPESRWRVDHWFYICVALLLILLNLAAFGPSLVNTTGRLGPPTTLVVAHGIVLFGFLLFFLTQVTLVATERTAVHSRFGMVGAVLAAMMIVSTYAMSVETARRGYDLSGDLQRLAFGPLRPDELRRRAPDPALGLALNVGQVLAFGLFVGAGIGYRRRPDVHKRLMLLAMVGILTGPPFAHLFGHWPVLTAVTSFVQLPISILLLCVTAIHDRVTEGRIHPVSLWGALLLFVWFPVWIAVVGPSAIWKEFVAALIR